MLDLLDNLPRLRLSDDHMKAIIWVLKECGAQHVPTFSTLRKKQAELTKDIGIRTDHHTSSLGNEFFSNSPANLFKLVRLSFINQMHIFDIKSLDAGFCKSTRPRVSRSLS